MNFKPFKNRWLVYGLCTLILAAATCHNTLVLASNKTDEEMTVEGNNQFALELYAQLSQTNDNNVFFSPASISFALAMASAGAREETERQMAETLHFSLPAERLHPSFKILINSLNPPSGKKVYELSIANALWIQKDYPLKKPFLDMTEKYYEGGLKEADFRKHTEDTRQAINAWVEQKTNNKIKALIKPGILTSLTRLVLTNAIYFNGTWIFPFKKQDTKPHPFNLMNGDKSEVAMMSQSKEFDYFENDTMQILQMPYEGDALSMVVFLPKEKDGIKNLEALLTIENLKTWLSSLQKQDVFVRFPAFKMSSDFLLKEPLKSLGIKDAFNDELADFSGIIAGPSGLHISQIIHKSFVNVTEEGTEASAATAVVFAIKSIAGLGPKPVFQADHPFIFMIRDQKSGSILFVGRVMDPNAD